MARPGESYKTDIRCNKCVSYMVYQVESADSEGSTGSIICEKCRYKYQGVKIGVGHIEKKFVRNGPVV